MKLYPTNVKITPKGSKEVIHALNSITLCEGVVITPILECINLITAKVVFKAAYTKSYLDVLEDTKIFRHSLFKSNLIEKPTDQIHLMLLYLLEEIDDF